MTDPDPRHQRAFTAATWMQHLHSGVLTLAYSLVLVQACCNEKKPFVIKMSTALIVTNALAFVCSFPIAEAFQYADPLPILYVVCNGIQAFCYQMAYWCFANRYLAISYLFDDILNHRPQDRTQVRVVLFWVGAALFFLSDLLWSFLFYGYLKSI